jgi:uncharacterized protein
MRTLLCVLGLVLVIEGIPYFAFPDKMKKWLSAIQGVPEDHLRLMGFISMILGISIAYLFRG